MPSYFNESLDLEEFSTIMAKNKPKHNVLRLKQEALSELLSDQGECLKRILKENTTLNYLSLSDAPLPKVLIPNIIEALTHNTSIIDLEYNPEGLSFTVIKQIEEIIRRNREEYLEKEVHPQVATITEKEYPDFFRDAQKAAAHGDLNILAALLPKIPNWSQKASHLGYSLLHTAAQYGQVACVRYLISKGANVNLNPKSLFSLAEGTALFRAVEHNHYLISFLLLSAGASTQEKSNGFTILECASTTEMARLLIKYQANPLAASELDTINTKFGSTQKNPILQAIEHEAKVLTQSTRALKLLSRSDNNLFFQAFPTEVQIKIIDATEEYNILDENYRENLIIKKLM